MTDSQDDLSSSRDSDAEFSEIYPLFRETLFPTTASATGTPRETTTGSRGGSSWGIMAHVYERVLNIITKPAEEREDSEIETILPWFRKKSDVFKELKTEILSDIVKNCEFATCQRDHVIIRQGEKGDNFYIILTGTVSVHINTNLTEDDFEQIKQKQLEEERNVLEMGRVKPLDRSKYGNYLAKITAGKSFGELALIRIDSVRNASIIADETTDLLVVNRELYNRSLHAYQAHEFDKKYGFVDEFPLFSGWNPRYKRMVAMSLVKKTLKFEDTVIRQATPVDGLHFIISGQVKIVVDPSQHQTQYPSLFPKGDIAALEREKARELLRREMNLEKSKAVKKKMAFQKRKAPQPESKKPTLRHLELCLMGAVDVIGDLEMALGLTTYAQSVICTEEAEVYQLDQRNYDRLIEKRNPHAIRMMKSIVHTKLSLHFSRLSEEKLPLFRYFLYMLDEKERKDRHAEQVAAASGPTAAADKPAEVSWKSYGLHKGPLVDLFGPGSVFYMIRMREKEKKKRTQKPKQFGGSKFGIKSAFTFGARALPEVTEGRAVSDNERLPRSNTAPGQNPFITEPTKAPTPTFPPKITYQGPDSEDYFENDMFQGKENKGRESTGSRQTLSPLYTDEDSGDETLWAIGDSALSRLEEKIQAWHSSLDDPETRPTSMKRAVRLHRYHAEERKPRPGNRVHMRLRDATRSVAIVTSRSDDDEMTTEIDNRQRSNSVTTHSPLSSSRICSSLAGDVEALKDSSKKLRKSDPSKRGRSSKRSILDQRSKQYTAEDYKALKEELRRRQRAYKSFLPNRTSYTVF